MKKWTIALAAVLLAAQCWAGEPVDINSASAEEIANGLDGVGQSKAELIVQYRQQNGNFRDADELVNVKGIGLSTVNKNRNYIKLGKNPNLASRKP